MIEVLVKVCGLTEIENALACASAGADWIGLNFHPASSRSTSVGCGKEIASALKGRAEPVGLFVDRPFVEMIRIVDEVGLGIIQLHGEESPDYLRQVARDRPEIRVVRAFRLAGRASIGRMVDYLDEAEKLGCPPYAILVDAHVAGMAGGTGHEIESDLLQALPAHPRLILAGGLTPANVADRVASVRPWMVDVASGVESSPGVKDLARVSSFVTAARGLAKNVD